jgi:folate-dependent phosphoribosylglycinamide formyltransferase PurN
MKVVFITGSHPRHAYIARKLACAGKLSALIIEKREAHLPEPPQELNGELSALFKEHFFLRQQVENTAFGDNSFPNVPTLHVGHHTLNTQKTWDYLTEYSPDLLLSYGCHMLTNETLSKVTGEKWNIHGGLSPWYRGAVTHFWPSYMLEPQMTGMTVHELTQQLDAGDIVHQCSSDLVRGDGLHQLAARSVTKIADELPRLIALMEKGAKIKKTPHKTAGKLWLGNNWRPEHLKLIYDVYNDKIVDLYLDGEFAQSKPILVRQFD